MKLLAKEDAKKLLGQKRLISGYALTPDVVRECIKLTGTAALTLDGVITLYDKVWVDAYSDKKLMWLSVEAWEESPLLPQMETQATKERN